MAVERLEWGCELFRYILNDKQADKVDLSHIASVSAVEMQVSKEYKDDVLGYFTSTMVPYMMESPDIHRFRLFEVDNATVYEGSKQETANKEDLRPYFCLVEFATEDYPWDVILEMADTDEWKRWIGDPKMMVCFDCVSCSEYANVAADMAGQPFPCQQTVHGTAQQRHCSAFHQQLRCDLRRRLVTMLLLPHSGTSRVPL